MRVLRQLLARTGSLVAILAVIAVGLEPAVALGEGLGQELALEAPGGDGDPLAPFAVTGLETEEEESKSRSRVFLADAERVHVAASPSTTRRVCTAHAAPRVALHGPPSRARGPPV